MRLSGPRCSRRIAGQFKAAPGDCGHGRRELPVPVPDQVGVFPDERALV